MTLHLRRPALPGVVASVTLAAALTACGTSGISGNASSSTPLAGQTINLVSSGAAGSSHDLEARAEAPYIAKYLHATVHVVDKPGGGQLLAWNYVYAAPPDGLTIGTVDVEGVLANMWEEVPNNNVKPDKIIMLGGMAGGVTGASEVMFAPKSLPWHDIYALLKERSSQVKELGSVGDVPGPLLFGAYHVPYKDLTSYASSTDELQGLLRGDGDLTVKSWAGSYAAYATGGKGQVLLAYTMRPTWKLRPSVPTVSQLLKKDPPSSAGEGTALVTDTTALDGGTGLFAPPGTPSAIVAALQKAVKYAITQPGFAGKAANAGISDTYESAAAQAAALRAGTVPATIATMRKYVPLHTGVAS